MTAQTSAVAWEVSPERARERAGAQSSLPLVPTTPRGRMTRTVPAGGDRFS
jgi:hypothetical protein